MLISEKFIVKAEEAGVVGINENVPATVAVPVMVQEIDSIEDELDRLREEKKAIESRIKAAESRKSEIRAALKEIVARTNDGCLESDKLIIRLHPGKPKVVVEDVKSLPDEVKRIKVEANKPLILNRIVSGEKIPGAKVVVGEDYVVIDHRTRGD